MRAYFFLTLLLFSNSINAENLETVNINEAASPSNLHTEILEKHLPLNELSPLTIEPTQNQLLVFIPRFMIGIPNYYPGIGVSYRILSKNSFYDFEVVQDRERVFQYVQNYITGVYEEETIGSIYLNNLIISKGISTNTKYVQFYLLGGTGVSYSLATVGKLKNNFYGLLSGRAGLKFKYGFIDIGANISLPTFSYQHSGTYKNHSYSSKVKSLALNASRMGLGFTY